MHWFNFKEFYSEVNRTAKSNSLLATIGYERFETDDKKFNEIILHLYKNIIGSYWDDERKYIDEKYLTIPFPFNEIKATSF